MNAASHLRIGRAACRLRRQLGACLPLSPRRCNWNERPQGRGTILCSVKRRIFTTKPSGRVRSEVRVTVYYLPTPLTAAKESTSFALTLSAKFSLTASSSYRTPDIPGEGFRLLVFPP